MGRVSASKLSIPKKVTAHKLPGALKNGPVPYRKNPIPIVPPDLFVLHSLCAFIGSRGSGKTHAMVNLALKYLQQGSLNRVFIITPTYRSNKIFEVLDPKQEDVYEDIRNTDSALQKILEATAKDAKRYRDYKEYLSAYKKWRRKSDHLSHDEMTLLENNHFKKLPVQLRPSPLLIVDDMSHTEIFNTRRSNPFPNLCLKHRHINEGNGITIFMAAQTFKTGIPKAIRQNIQQFFIWPTKDLTQLEAIYDEVANLATKEEFLEMYRRATTGSHSFLTVDNNPKHHLLQFRKNFDTVLLRHNTEETDDDDDDNEITSDTPSENENR